MTVENISSNLHERILPTQRGVKRTSVPQRPAQIPSICSQDIEQKQNVDNTQGP